MNSKVIRGRDGRDGRDGLAGAHGRSAYEMACEAGYQGSLKLFLEQIIGRDALTDGQGIYESAVANGFTGNYEKLIELLQGPKGDKGEKGDKGDDGRSAYEVAVANGYSGSEAQWLRSLKGEKGEDGERGPKGDQGERGPAGPAGTISGGGGGSIYAKGIRLVDEGGYFVEKNVEAALQELGAGGGGGGAVASVNGQTGVVVLDAADVGAASAADLAGYLPLLLPADTTVDLAEHQLKLNGDKALLFIDGDGTSGTVTHTGEFFAAFGGTSAETLVNPQPYNWLSYAARSTKVNGDYCAADFFANNSRDGNGATGTGAGLSSSDKVGTVARLQSFTTTPGGGPTLYSEYTDSANPGNDSYSLLYLLASLGSSTIYADSTTFVCTGAITASNLSGTNTGDQDLSGKADLVGGVVPTSQIPAIAITEYLGSVASQATMLALVGQKGDWALRSDLGTTWVITGNDPTQLADWTQLSYPTAPVTSVNSQTGAVTLAKGDIGLGNVDNTSDANKPVSSATQTALNLKANLASPTFTGTVGGITAAMVGAPSGSGTSSGANTGDQSSIVGITGTKAQFDTAVTDDNFAYTGTANSFTQGQTITPAVNASALTAATQTHTTSAPALNLAQTWNAAGVTFTGIFGNFTSTASAAGSLLMDLQLGGVSKFAVSKTGKVTLTENTGVSAFEIAVSGQPVVGIGRNSSVGGLDLYSNGGTTPFFNISGAGALFGTSAAWFGWTSGNIAQTIDTAIGRAGLTNAIVIAGTAGSAVAGGTKSRTEVNKEVTGIANATATDVLTVTIPNAAHAAQLYIELCGSLGAGGAVGACEATATNCYTVTFTRTAGVNAVATISAASGASACAVAGAATVTCVGTLSAVTGAVGASNSFTIKATISRSAGSSANHTCLVYAKLMNKNATGISIA